LTLQVAVGALARHRGHALGTMLGRDRAGAGLELPRVIGAESTGDDAHAVAIEIQRTRQPIASGGMEYGCPSCITTPVGVTLTAAPAPSARFSVAAAVSDP